MAQYKKSQLDPTIFEEIETELLQTLNSDIDQKIATNNSSFVAPAIEVETTRAQNQEGAIINDLLPNKLDKEQGAQNGDGVLTTIGSGLITVTKKDAFFAELQTALGNYFEKVANKTQNIDNPDTKSYPSTPAIKQYVNELVGAITTITIAGPYPSLASVTSPQPNILYLIGTDAPYEEYLYINNAWELVGSTSVDLSDYFTKEETTDLLDTKVDSTNVADQVYGTDDSGNPTTFPKSSFGAVDTVAGVEADANKDIPVNDLLTALASLGKFVEYYDPANSDYSIEIPLTKAKWDNDPDADFELGLSYDNGSDIVYPDFLAMGGQPTLPDGTLGTEIKLDFGDTQTSTRIRSHERPAVWLNETPTDTDFPNGHSLAYLDEVQSETTRATFAEQSEVERATEVEESLETHYIKNAVILDGSATTYEYVYGINSLVFYNGIKLTPDTDYIIDEEAETITFTEVLSGTMDVLQVWDYEDLISEPVSVYLKVQLTTDSSLRLGKYGTTTHTFEFDASYAPTDAVSDWSAVTTWNDVGRIEDFSTNDSNDYVTIADSLVNGQYYWVKLTNIVGLEYFGQRLNNGTTVYKPCRLIAADYSQYVVRDEGANMEGYFSGNQYLTNLKLPDFSQLEVNISENFLRNLCNNCNRLTGNFTLSFDSLTTVSVGGFLTYAFRNTGTDSSVAGQLGTITVNCPLLTRLPTNSFSYFAQTSKVNSIIINDFPGIVTQVGANQLFAHFAKDNNLLASVMLPSFPNLRDFTGNDFFISACSNCTALSTVRVPSFPAIQNWAGLSGSQTQSAFSLMFNGCTSLTGLNAIDIPATNADSGGFYNDAYTFDRYAQNCSGLLTLAAPTLAFKNATTGHVTGQLREYAGGCFNMVYLEVPIVSGGSLGTVQDSSVWFSNILGTFEGHSSQLTVKNLDSIPCVNQTNLVVALNTYLDKINTIQVPAASLEAYQTTAPWVTYPAVVAKLSTY